MAPLPAALVAGPAAASDAVAAATRACVAEPADDPWNPETFTDVGDPWEPTLGQP